jgi:hypothetical protein
MPQLLRVAATNWRTTTASCLAAAAAIANAAIAIVDADPSTQPDWTLVISLVSAAVGLFFARDVGVTSKQLGLDK